jgi:hypothetical protein
LLECGEPMSVSQKVDILIRNLRSDKLANGCDSISMDPEKSKDFLAATAQLKTLVSKKISHEKSRGNNKRGVSGVGTEPGSNKRKHTDNIPNEEWWGMSQDEHDKIVNARKKANGNSGGGSSSSGPTTIKGYKRVVKALESKVAELTSNTRGGTNDTSQGSTVTEKESPSKQFGPQNPKK